MNSWRLGVSMTMKISCMATVLGKLLHFCGLHLQEPCQALMMESKKDPLMALARKSKEYPL